MFVYVRVYVRYHTLLVRYGWTRVVATATRYHIYGWLRLRVAVPVGWFGLPVVRYGWLVTFTGPDGPYRLPHLPVAGLRSRCVGWLVYGLRLLFVRLLRLLPHLFCVPIWVGCIPLWLYHVTVRSHLRLFTVVIPRWLDTLLPLTTAIRAARYTFHTHYAHVYGRYDAPLPRSPRYGYPCGD